MLELFGFAWVTITFACCVAAIYTRRSVRGWLLARGDRRRRDDTVEIVRRPLRKVATYTALVVLALPAGVLAGGTALPGPSGGGGGLPTVGGTMTGQVVFSGVSTDITSASNEAVTIAPAGSGAVELQTTTGDVNIDTTTGNMTLDCTTAGGEGCLRITHADTNGNGLWIENASGTNYVRLRSGSTTSSCAVDFIKSTSARAAQIAYMNGGSALTDYSNKLYAYTESVEFRHAELNDIAAGTYLFTVNDLCAGSSCVRQFGVDGNGAVKFRDLTSAHGSACGSTTEGMLYYRSIAGSNKSGFCACAETSSGVYAWKAALTFGSSALTDGDC